MSNILDAFKEDHTQKVSVDTDKKIRIGIIGTGWIAGAHAEAFKHMPDLELVAASDLIPGKAAAFVAEHGFKNVKTDYKDHLEMINDDSLGLDAVSICTYNCQHAVCTIDALNKGLHVLLEKPMCVTLEEAVEICRAEKRSGKILSIGFQPRFDENMKMVKKICQSGELGKIYYIQTGGGRRRGIPTPFGTTFIEKETGGIGALGDIGCYSLDMIMNAIGHPKPLTVTGYKSAYFGTDPKNYPGHPEYAEKFGVDDFAAGFVRLEGDIIIDFRIAWAMNLDTPGDTIIMGTKGGLRIPSTECWNGSIGGPMTIYHEVGGAQVQTQIPVLKTSEDCFHLKVRYFLDACKGICPSPVPASEILYNQAILSGIAKSAELGHEIEIDIPEI
ncbi:MAG: Gfo/Idh/MocA family oxidoreductase [Ruminococcaceae bacterium]|nr:Gfo/Idh/MocA family oxidoreductase [Oscillospiraceae bacterium]